MSWCEDIDKIVTCIWGTDTYTDTEHRAVSAKSRISKDKVTCM